MIGRKAASRLGKSILPAIFSLVLSTGAMAQEARIERVGVSVPVVGVMAAGPLGSALPGAGGFFLAAPSISALVPSAVSAAMPAAASRRNQEIAAEAGGAAMSAPIVRPEGNDARREASAPVSAAMTEERSGFAETDRDGAERDFSALLGERLAESKGAASAPVAATPSSASAPRLSWPARNAASFLFGVPAVVALAFHPTLPAVAQHSPAVWHAISQAGNVIGNLGCAVFPLVQIYETFHGKSTPKFRAMLGAAASLGLGLISAPLMHDALWGFQNIFGGLTLLVPLLIGGIAGRARGNGLKETVLISAAAAAVSLSVYFALAATLPALLAAALSAAAIGKLSLGVQVATSAMFIWMYLPEAIRGLRGKSTDGFSQGFTLVYCISSAASMIWALPAAWILHDPHQLSYRLIFGVNTIYAATSFISYWVARRRAAAR